MTGADERNDTVPGLGAPAADAPARPRPRTRQSKGTKRAGKKGLPLPARLGFALAAITFLLDQASKLYLLFVYELPIREPVALSPFLNLEVVWNRGISYGLFQQSTDLGRWVLIGISILAAIGLSIWIRRTSGKLLAASLGLIVGGAVGNVIDRLAYGAVFDFLHFHVGTWSWYVFNVADAAIVAGVVGLLYDSFVLERRRTR